MAVHAGMRVTSISCGRACCSHTDFKPENGMEMVLQVVDRSETEVTCVATNSATLDGLLNVMVCHTEASRLGGLR